MLQLQRSSLTLIVCLSATPLLAVSVLGARRPSIEGHYPSARAAIAACQQWQKQEGLFSTGTAEQSTQTRIRTCVVDLDRPLVLGHRYSVVVGAHYNRPLENLHRKLSQRFPFQLQTDDTDL